ncbi:MAG: 2-isopropylmalate synthase [Actinomycetota bacterium]|nr:2-isopropylmalate synthase [Actinomycetota bacterium]
MTDRVYIFDTTLRDGEQSPGISLNVREKLEIAEQLARLGVDVIEAGFPITSPGDFEAVSTIAKKVKGPIIAGLARAVDADIDRAWEAVKAAERSRIHTFIATSDIHIERKLKKNKDEVVEMAKAAVARAKGYTDDVEFSPEDATRSDFEFLCRIVRAAIDSGATVINIPDTVGYALPEEFADLIKQLRERLPELGREVILSVHCHNDLGLAVANSLVAVAGGANQIECTINGLGERAGNAALEELVMIMDTRARSMNKTTGIKTDEISRTSKLISSLTGYSVQFNKAIVGRNAFAHSSGIHTDGMLKDRTTYEIMSPERIGLAESRLILGKTSGRHAFRAHLEELGHQLDSAELDRAFGQFKTLADKKAQITNEDIEAIVAEEVRTVTETYKLEYLSVASATDETPTATIKLRRGVELLEQTNDGDGPVDAVCKAISAIAGMPATLLSYNVSAITGSLDAQGDVTVNLRINGRNYLGRGISTDIIEASAKAYLNAINKAVGVSPAPGEEIDREL